MNPRRPLVDGIAKSLPDIDAQSAANFVAGEKAPRSPQFIEKMPRVPLTSRIRKDLWDALKRSSLERQMSGETPSAVQEILEEALTPWLKSHGYLS